MTGLAGGVDGRIAIIINVGAFDLVLKDESASSTDVNRFDIGEDITVGPQQGVIFRYDGTLSRWYCIGSWLGMPGGTGVPPDADYGDIVVSGGVWTIENEAVTLAKIEFIADQTILGNILGGVASPQALTASQVRTVLELATSDSPQFAGIELGHASDTTLTRSAAGVVQVEGKTLVNLTDGGTFLVDISVPDEAYGAGWNGSVEVPTKNAVYDKIQTLTGTGDVVGPGVSTDKAIARYVGTTGKLVQDSNVIIGDNGAVYVYVSDGVTNASTTLMALYHRSSGTPAAGFAGTVQLRLDSATVDDRTALDATIEWVDATDASRKAKFRLYTYDTAARECLALAASGSAAQIGFLGASPSAALASPDLGTLATTFGLATGTPTFGAANLTGTSLPSGLVASQSAQETGTSTVLAVTPGVQQYHASACKCWIYVTQSGTQTIQASYNVTSISDGGTGITSVTIATDFSSANYAIVLGININTGVAARLINYDSKAAGSFSMNAGSNPTTGTDAPVDAACFGDQ